MQKNCVEPQEVIRGRSGGNHVGKAEGNMENASRKERDCRTLFQLKIF